MLFNIEADTGKEIIGYLVPDNFDKSPILEIKDQGEVISIIQCDQERYSLVAAGRHGSGLCGFLINESNVKGLAGRHNIEIFDAETGLLIYRRRNPATVIQKKILRLETHLYPLWSLDDALEQKFQIFYKSIDRLGRESTTQTFHLDNIRSLYVSGRIAIKPYESLIQDRFLCIMMMHEPFYELAERLMILKNVGKLKNDILGPRDSVYFDPVISFAQNIFSDKKQLRKAFDIMPKEVINILRNPITRQLSAESLDDPSPKGGVARSLSTLSRFSLVGIRDQETSFFEDVAASVGLSVQSIKMPPRFPSVDDLAVMLKNIPEAEFLLDQDLEIYYILKGAIERSTNV